MDPPPSPTNAQATPPPPCMSDKYRWLNVPHMFKHHARWPAAAQTEDFLDVLDWGHTPPHQSKIAYKNNFFCPLDARAHYRGNTASAGCPGACAALPGSGPPAQQQTRLCGSGPEGRTAELTLDAFLVLVFGLSRENSAAPWWPRREGAEQKPGGGLCIQV